MELLFVLLVVAIVYIVAIRNNAKKHNSDTTSNLPIPEAKSDSPVEPSEPPKYAKRERVMNRSERQMYRILQNNLGDRFIILSKVRIEDFVEVPEDTISWGERQGLRGKIKSRHVDFLICNLENAEPLMAVEVDGASHTTYKQRERDMFVDELYEKIDLPVRHIRVGSNFYEQTMAIRQELAGGQQTVEENPPTTAGPQMQV